MFGCTMHTDSSNQTQSELQIQEVPRSIKRFPSCEPDALDWQSVFGQGVGWHRRPCVDSDYWSVVTAVQPLDAPCVFT